MARGPAYPYVNLEEAIEMTRKLYEYARRSPAPVESVAKNAWKYSPTSSSTVKVIAALKYFGLAEEVAGEKGKSLKITDRAYRILVDSKDSPEWRQCVRDAALSPRWYQFCWNTWGKELPPSMRSTLIFNHHFVESTVDAFLRDYRKTISFAGLLDDEPSADSEGDSTSESDNSANVGERVESIKILDAPSHGECGQPEPRVAANLAAQPVKGGPAMRQDVFSLSEGNVIIQWPASLSQESLQDLKDWLKILERKISRSAVTGDPASQDASRERDEAEKG